jgi:hypothetical protein
MRQFTKNALILIMGLIGGAAAAAAEQSLVDRIEMLDWTDPERAERLFDAQPVSTERGAPEVQMLEVGGMVYADVHRDSDVDATIARLEAIAQGGDKSAIRAEHYVRAYSLYQRGQYRPAAAELSLIDMESIATNAERYRV